MTQICPMVSVNFRTHVTTYAYYADPECQMPKWIVMCRFIDKKFKNSLYS